LPVARSSDNYFELYPGEPRTVSVEFSASVTPKQIRSALRVCSLRDSYL